MMFSSPTKVLALSIFLSLISSNDVCLTRISVQSKAVLICQEKGNGFKCLPNDFHSEKVINQESKMIDQQNLECTTKERSVGAMNDVSYTICVDNDNPHKNNTILLNKVINCDLKFINSLKERRSAAVLLVSIHSALNDSELPNSVKESVGQGFLERNAGFRFNFLAQRARILQSVQDSLQSEQDSLGVADVALNAKNVAFNVNPSAASSFCDYYDLYCYNSSLSPGAIVGIVIGSIAGAILLVVIILAIIYTCQKKDNQNTQLVAVIPDNTQAGIQSQQLGQAIINGQGQNVLPNQFAPPQPNNNNVPMYTSEQNKGLLDQANLEQQNTVQNNMLTVPDIPLRNQQNQYGSR